MWIIPFILLLLLEGSLASLYMSDEVREQACDSSWGDENSMLSAVWSLPIFQILYCPMTSTEKSSFKYKELQSDKDCSLPPELCQPEGIILFSLGTTWLGISILKITIFYLISEK